jgi:excisionase family DNA binding protein
LGEPEKTKYLTPNQVADLLMVKPITVRKWAQNGELKAALTPGGHRRFLPDDVNDFLAQRKKSNRPKKSNSPKILIVDDDAQVSSYLSDFLALDFPNYTTEIAMNGYEAGFKILDFNPSLVLLDLMMPGIDGYQVCEQIKSNPNTRHIRVIAMTGFSSEDNIERIKNAGAEYCLQKPISKTELRGVFENKITEPLEPISAEQ